MPTSYLDAKTFGIGELITQKKRFRVPDHQRDYSWTDEAATEFIGDVLEAIERGAPDYFLGLIVLIGPEGGVFRILDGQQRLATTTMLFAAVRHWLSNFGFEDDAKQVDAEFIAVRQLGGDPEPRIVLNRSDRAIFSEIVTGRVPMSRLLELQEQLSRGTSNRRLAEAAIACWAAVEGWARGGGSDREHQVRRLYALSSFLEKAVQVVCLQVDSEADAYIIFESLNNRGHDLSVLDLVKNHIFGIVGEDRADIVNDNWSAMLKALGERDADDLLKVYWTAQFGRVQRGSLFKSIREAFGQRASALHLSSELIRAAEIHAALDEPKHDLWLNFESSCQQHIEALRLLRGRQVRPVIFACIYKGMDGFELSRVLWALVVLTFRYQTVGKRRTGALEIACARVAHAITTGALGDVHAMVSAIAETAPNDVDFEQDFRRYSETNQRRALYALAALEFQRAGPAPGYEVEAVANALGSGSECAVGLFTSGGRASMTGEDWGSRIAGWCLIERHFAPPSRSSKRLGVPLQTARSSTFRTTNMSFLHYPLSADGVSERQKELAYNAVQVWRFS